LVGNRRSVADPKGVPDPQTFVRALEEAWTHPVAEAFADTISFAKSFAKDLADTTSRSRPQPVIRAQDVSDPQSLSNAQIFSDPEAFSDTQAFSDGEA
jgi:hypothetical protein